MADRPDRPLTFEEAVAVQDPARIARLENGESFKDRSLSDFYSEVIVHEDCEGNGDWIVDYFDDDGGCYVTIFAGPECEKRSRPRSDARNTGTRNMRNQGDRKRRKAARRRRENQLPGEMQARRVRPQGRWFGRQAAAGRGEELIHGEV